jgi:hypothetical protein
MMMIAFTLFIIGYSLWAIYQAMNLYDANNMSSFYVYGFMGILGLVLGLFSLAQLRRRMQPPPGGIAPKVTSVVLCSNCGFKVVRSFATGDFIRKEAGKCQQCTAGTMYIDSIYAEETKKQ